MSKNSEIQFLVDFEKGDCIITQIPDGKYIGFIVVGDDLHAKYNRLVLTNIYSDTKPTMNSFTHSSILAYYNGPFVTPAMRKLVPHVPRELDGSAIHFEVYMLYPYAKNKYIHELSLAAYPQLAELRLIEMQKIGKLRINLDEFNSAFEHAGSGDVQVMALGEYYASLSVLLEKLKTPEWYTDRPTETFFQL